MDQSILGEIAGEIVHQIEYDIHRYRPKKGKSFSSSSSGWRGRLLNYQWPPGRNFWDAAQEVAPLAEQAGALAKRLNEDFTEVDKIDLFELSRKIFDWGKVGKGKNYNADHAEAVVRSATAGYRINDAPMSASWTKLAALATEYLDSDDRSQIIFDSRVANSLINRIERSTFATSLSNQSIFITLKNTLGDVQGRGGSRTLLLYQERRKNGWRPHTYQGRAAQDRWWNAQFFASNLVRNMKHVLNENEDSFGKMPGRNGSADIAWTTRAVEMVLFMDGY